MKPCLAAVFVILPTFLGCASLQSGVANHTSVPDVERWVDSSLPIGSTCQEIETWLSAQGIEHSFSDLTYLNRTAGNCELEENYSGTITAIIRNTDHSFWVTGSIQLCFVLGKDNTLTKRSVKW